LIHEGESVMPEVVKGGRRGFDGVGREKLDINFHCFRRKCEAAEINSGFLVSDEDR
jgi:hypothetical protein